MVSGPQWRIWFRLLFCTPQQGKIMTGFSLEGLISFLFQPARAWFPLDTVQLENSLQKGPLDSLSTVGRLEDLMEGLNFVFPFVDKVCQKYSQVILGGFSQGALMALELTLGGHFDLKINKLILFSAVLTEEDSWKKKLQSSPHLPSDFAIFQGHGREDPLLSLYSAQKLRDILLAGPLPLDYHEFTGGHEIPPSLLEQCDRFLNNSRSVGTKK